MTVFSDHGKQSMETVDHVKEQHDEIEVLTSIFVSEMTGTLGCTCTRLFSSVMLVIREAPMPPSPAKLKTIFASCEVSCKWLQLLVFLRHNFHQNWDEIGEPERSSAVRHTSL